MMLTLPALVQAAVMPLLGRFAGKMLKYRSATLIGMALIALGGCIPALFAPDWGFVLFCHGLGLGVGGALLGMRSTLLLESVPEAQAGKMMGAAVPAWRSCRSSARRCAGFSPWAAGAARFI